MKFIITVFFVVLVFCVLIIGSVSANARVANLKVNNTLALSNLITKSEVSNNQNKRIHATGEKANTENKFLPKTGIESEHLVVYIGWFALLLSLFLFSWSYKLNRREKYK